MDECHRGYLLDRQLSDTELTFRGFDDYVSKYRRVLEYFDAFKVGLTATPALHTVDIFGTPIFAIPIQAKPGWERIGFDTEVPMITEQIIAAERQGAVFEHAYDY